MKNKMATTAATILMKAADLVGGDRANTHGDFWETHDNIARLWSAYLHNLKSADLTAHHVCNMLELMKVGRRKNGERNQDDYVDGAGYAGGAWQCVVHEDLWRQAEISNSEDTPTVEAGGLSQLREEL